MALTFPTQAELALEEFRIRNATKTVSLAKIARKRGASVEHKWDRTVYTFDDDTSLEVFGRGKAHRVEVHLP